MAISKRTRFEVLRRDKFTCRYCRATDNPLTVDHVAPVSLGGTDDPSNLVTACRDCNAGKSSSSPDSDTVADVEEDAARWAAAMKRAAQERQANQAAADEELREFYAYWEDATASADLPPDWASTIRSFLTAGLTMDDLRDATNIAMARLSPYSRKHWRYFCGVCHNFIKAITERALEILEEGGES